MELRAKMAAVLCLCVCGPLLAQPAPAARPAPIRVLMVVGGGYHNYTTEMNDLAARLGEGGEVQVRMLDDVGALTPEKIAGCDVLMFNTCVDKALTPEQMKAITAAVHGGTGLVAMHCALFSFQDIPEWRRMVGGLVLKHDPFGPYDVKIVYPSHPIAAEVPARFTVEDEPYFVDERGGDIQVIAETAQKHGGRPTVEPQVWTTRYAGGRVFVMTLGHDQRAQKNPAFLRLLGNGIRWAAGRLGPPTMPSELEIADGFKPLFDGKTLKGWHGNTKHWSVKDGCIVGRTTPPGRTVNTYAITDGEYGDFILRFAIWLSNNNTGVQFRSKELADYEVAGYQADANVGGWGNLHEQNGRGRLVDGWTGKGEFCVNPKDWVDMEVEARGPHIIVRTNGIVTADYTETDATKPRSGIIGIQLHRGDPLEVRCTNIRIKPLKEGK